MSLLPHFRRGRVEAGCDEAGRGCLAGPVTAAAVILPARFNHPLLNDSKKLTHAQREELRPIIEQKALAWAVAHVYEREIEKINILWASFTAMHLALDQLKQRPDFLLIDGNRFLPYHDVPFECIIKGDAKYRSIAAASILAKTHRDAYMAKLSNQFPDYGWSQNKGYPTIAHRSAIQQLGPTMHHRMTFNLLGHPKQGDLFEEEG